MSPTGFGIHQCRVKVHGQPGPNVFHLQIANGKLQRRFFRIRVINQQVRILAHELVNDYRDLPGLRFHLAGKCAAAFFRRNIQLHAFHVYCVDVHYRPKQVAYSGMKVELPNADQRLHPGLVRIRVGRAVDLQPAAINFQPFDYRNPQTLQLHAALESVR